MGSKKNWTGGLYDFRLTTGWACGLIRMDGRTGLVIQGGAPIFQRFVGQKLLRVVSDGGYKLEPLGQVKPDQLQLW